MRILHLAKYYWPRSGGMERVVQTLAEGAANLGHDVEVVAVESRGRSPSPGRTRSALRRSPRGTLPPRGSAPTSFICIILTRWQTWLACCGPAGLPWWSLSTPTRSAPSIGR
jgi:hypothetical protein